LDSFFRFSSGLANFPPPVKTPTSFAFLAIADSVFSVSPRRATCFSGSYSAAGPQGTHRLISCCARISNFPLLVFGSVGAGAAGFSLPAQWRQWILDFLLTHSAPVSLWYFPVGFCSCRRCQLCLVWRAVLIRVGCVLLSPDCPSDLVSSQCSRSSESLPADLISRCSLPAGLVFVASFCLLSCSVFKF
jgi:hypothetical protein